MTRKQEDSAARRRAFSQRLSAAIDAQRRLVAQRADQTQGTADARGPSNPRYTYLTRSHD